MKNKGRRHKYPSSSDMLLSGICNCKGYYPWITRPIRQMSSRTNSLWKVNKNAKKHWSKRVRGYFKSQTKEIL